MTVWDIGESGFKAEFSVERLSPGELENRRGCEIEARIVVRVEMSERDLAANTGLRLGHKHLYVRLARV